MNMPSVFTVALVPVADAARLRDMIISKFKEHDIDIVFSGEMAKAAMEEFGLTVELTPTPNGLQARIGAPSEGHLQFMREEMVEATEKIDPIAAEGIRWDDRDIEPTRPVNFHVFTVVRTRDVMDGLRRITLHGPAAPALIAGGGYHVRAILPKHLERKPVWPTLAPNGGVQWPEGENELHARTLTVRAVDVKNATVDFDIAVHDGGFVSDWVQSAEAGGEVGVMGPGGELGPPQNGPHLFVCDRTGFAAVARNLDALNDPAASLVIAACPDPDQATAYFEGFGAEVVGVAEHVFEGHAAELIQSHTDKRTFEYAWFGGEFSDAQAVRSVFRKDMKLGKGKQLSVAYWRRGHAGEA